MVFYGALDFLFGWAIRYDPVFALAFVTFLATLFVTLAYKYFTDQQLLKSLREDMDNLRKEAKSYGNDLGKLKSHNGKVWEKQLEMMKQNFKPMLLTLVPFFILFAWLRITYEALTFSFLGITSWFWLYFLFSIIFSLLLRKILKVY